MEEQVYLCRLYDYYGVLLTEKQQNYFESYYFDNLTLQEISENANVTRNAIHKSLKEVLEKLKEYESKLHLLEKRDKLDDILSTLDKKLKEQIENNL